MSKFNVEIDCEKCGGPMAIGVRGGLVVWRCQDCGEWYETDEEETAEKRRE